jgi:hypothetical protein
VLFWGVSSRSEGITVAKTLKAICLVTCLVVLRPALADYSDLQASTSGFSGQNVTVAVHNPTSGAVSARVHVVVRVDEETFYLLTSSNFSVAAGATISVQLSAPAPVAEIIEEPEPISQAY